MTKAPTIGEMRMLMQFNRPVKNSDQTGGQEEQYEAWFTCRGYIEFERGWRAFETGMDKSIKTYNCWIPWRNEIEVNMTKDVHVIFEAREFRVDTFRMVHEQRRMMHLQLTEVR